ncbi:hypothetical protein [Vibrio proteolyticus]|uniref:Uncharacterized protein n=1 Tax=Vibrio proteolyticus NBRC 13287 TaxID=1219065 RepID=U3BIV1_VIBPR|nr:hypothetical protein [Vibrio proteolyticus]GAD69564.1 hypothetical protein VPR01S_39_00020 [Vibrio proteolyticus NBRC 13287]
MAVERVEAIKTTYKGIEYRSRTEARWAVFFDGIGVQFEYEKEYIDLSNGQKYLPDFFLPEFNAFFEVKPNSDAIVTEECTKARLLSQDLADQAINVWLATGGPSEQNGNVIPLNHWDLSDDIEHILSVRENRYMFYQDRRDEGIYWLYAVDHTDTMRSAYFIGGWGTETDHLKEPMMFGQVQAAYQRAREYPFEN